MKIFRMLLVVVIAEALFPTYASGADCSVLPTMDSASIDRIFKAIKSKGNIFKEIRLLDSLRISGLDNEEFLGNYARYVFHTFMPEKKGGFSVLLKNDDQIQPTDTAFPCAFKWNIVSSQKALLPFFEYRAGFAFRKQFRLVFTGLRHYSPGLAWLQFSNRKPPLSNISADLIGQLNDRIDSAWFAIHIDLNDTRISPYEYIIKRISGIYDSIEAKSDLSKYHAISLRCYRRGFFVNPEGTYTAYIIFDRRVMDILKNDSAFRKTPARDADKSVRYTLTMRCGCDVQDMAEAKLQSLFHAF
jgi:hypothetical protein